MDDILYYVESPDGQVLGPMSMMHIMEGIAEGAILESALVCEVGAPEWIPLSDLAFAREDGSAPQEPEEVIEHFIRDQPILDALSEAEEQPPSTMPIAPAPEPALSRAERFDLRPEPPAPPSRPVPQEPRFVQAFEETREPAHEERGFDLPAEDPFESEAPSRAGEWSSEAEEDLVPAGQS
ncbi:MAG: hypothetical protein ACT4PE_02065, partial [Candidatus Eiseniibacteriota bacterium]